MSDERGLSIPGSLLLLMKLRFRAGLRQTVRNLKTPRGIIFSVFGALIAVLWLGGMIAVGLMRGPQQLIQTRAVAPLVMLGFTFLSVLGSNANRGIVFTPAEIDFLFPGPFTRRQLLLYKLASGAVGSLLVALFVAVWLMRSGAGYWVAYVTILLGLTFLQFLGAILALLGQTISEYAFTRTRQAALLILAGLAVAAVAPAALSGWGGIAEVTQSFAGRLLLAPFYPFAVLLTAQTWSELALGGAGSFAIDALLFFIVIKLDANYLESSLITSQKLYERVAKMRRGGGGLGAATVNKTIRFHLPAFPHMLGVGPILWRQTAVALRHSRGIVTTLVVFGAFIAFALMGKAPKTDSFIFPMVAWLGFMMPMQMRFDFRGDLDYLPVLKSLPLHPLAVAGGQLMGSVVILSAIELCAIALMTFWFNADVPAMQVAALAVTPFNLLMLGIDNLLFLVFPTRTVGFFQNMGRNMVSMVVRMLVLGATAGGSVAVAFIVSRFTGGTLFPAALVGVFVLSCCALASIPAVAWAFARFDPAVDTPT